MFDVNRESEGHDFFRLGGMDLSKDGRWLLYGVDVTGDERYDFRIRDLESLTATDADGAFPDLDMPMADESLSFRDASAAEPAEATAGDEATER